MSDLFAPLQKHLKTIAVAAAAVLIFAVAIGLLIGLMRRPTEEVPGELPLEDLQSRSEELESETAGTALLMPSPVLPHGREDEQMLFYLDRHPEFIDSFELIPISVEELIQHRKRGVEAGVKPFRFMGEELEILTTEDELVEP